MCLLIFAARSPPSVMSQSLVPQHSIFACNNQALMTSVTVVCHLSSCPRPWRPDRVIVSALWIGALGENPPWPQTHLCNSTRSQLSHFLHLDCSDNNRMQAHATRTSAADANVWRRGQIRFHSRGICARRGAGWASAGKCHTTHLVAACLGNAVTQKVSLLLFLSLPCGYIINKAYIQKNKVKF